MPYREYAGSNLGPNCLTVPEEPKNKMMAKVLGLQFSPLSRTTYAASWATHSCPWGGEVIFPEPV